jgi:hypothetical protein
MQPMHLISVESGTFLKPLARPFGLNGKGVEYVIVYTEYAIMETEKIGMREFRENLAG